MTGHPLPIAYLSIKEDPGVCKQLTLSFVRKFLSTAVPSNLKPAEAETLRYAHRIMRPFAPQDVSVHLQIIVSPYKSDTARFAK